MKQLCRTVVAALAVAVVLALVCISGPVVVAQEGQRISLRVIGWNMQSDFTSNRRESDPEVLKRQMGRKKGVHLWGLCEVLNAATLAKFKQGAEEGEDAEFDSILSESGGRDRTAILFDTSRFKLLDHEELGMVRVTPGLRAPLVGHFRIKATGQEFLFMVNHLKRGGAQNPVRLQQAELLNEWVRTQTLPVVAVGDYNFDYHVERGDLGVPHRDGGFDALTKDSKFKWVRPERLVKSQASDDFNTLLDFVFVANAPFGWFAESHILERDGDELARENDFDDDDRETDHRPVDALFTFRPRGGGGDVARAAARATPERGEPSREELLREISDLEQQLQRLRRRVQELER